MPQSLEVLHDRYQLQSSLGRNAGRQTWLAFDQKIKCQVVVKLLTFSDQVDWDHVRLFEREATILKNLSHPQIPRYIDSFCLDDRLRWGGLVQSYIPSPSLKQLLDQGQRFEAEEVRQIAKQILDLLGYLHGLSPPVLHRDIKPSNLLMDEQGTVFLVDFGAVQDGVAKAGGTFTIVGTYGYAPLEQLGGQATFASDLYALGATLIHLLTAIAPADLPQVNGRLQFPEDLSLNPGLVRWLWRLTAPSVQERFTTAREALEALQGHERAISTTVDDLPRKSRLKVERSPNYLKIFLPRTSGWIKLDSHCFDLRSSNFFGFSSGRKRGSIVDIESISEGKISRYSGSDLRSVMITVGVDECHIECHKLQDVRWLIRVIQQWLGLEDSQEEWTRKQQLIRFARFERKGRHRARQELLEFAKLRIEHSSSSLEKLDSAAELERLESLEELEDLSDMAEWEIDFLIRQLEEGDSDNAE
jgi:serine/threonine protein kinase